MTRLEYLRRSQGLSQQALGQRAGVGWKSISNLERGHWAKPSRAYLTKLALVVGGDPDQLLDNIEDEEEQVDTPTGEFVPTFAPGTRVQLLVSTGYGVITGRIVQQFTNWWAIEQPTGRVVYVQVHHIVDVLQTEEQ